MMIFKVYCFFKLYLKNVHKSLQITKLLDSSHCLHFNESYLQYFESSERLCYAMKAIMSNVIMSNNLYHFHGVQGRNLEMGLQVQNSWSLFSGQTCYGCLST